MSFFFSWVEVWSSSVNDLLNFFFFSCLRCKKIKEVEKNKSFISIHIYIYIDLA